MCCSSYVFVTRTANVSIVNDDRMTDLTNCVKCTNFDKLCVEIYMYVCMCKCMRVKCLAASTFSDMLL